MNRQPTTMNGEAWGLLVLLSVLRGGAFAFVGVAVRELPPMTVVLAAIGTALAYPVFFRILVGAGASKVMPVTLLVPVGAMTLGTIHLDEPARAREIADPTVIGLGLLFIDGRIPRLVKRVASRHISNLQRTRQRSRIQPPVSVARVIAINARLRKRVKASQSSRSSSG